MSSSVYRLSPPSSVLTGEVFIPGSKSYTNRALILAALADGTSKLVSPSHSDDSRVLCDALAKLGVLIEDHEGDLVVHGRGGNLTPFKGEINVGPAGTSMRFLAALCPFIEGAEIILSGSERMHKRPIRELVEALRTLGAQIEYLGDEGCPPLRIVGIGRAKNGSVKMQGSISSQFFSALLLASSLLKADLSIEVEGEQISKSYIDMTLSSLKAFGIEAKNESYKKYLVPGSMRPKPITYQVEGDASGASYFWGLAAVSKGRVRVKNIDPNSAQGDVGFPKLLEKMGCTVSSGYESGAGWIEVVGHENLKGIAADMEQMPDTAQTLSVVAACASGKTHITGLSTLRIKETDRLLAVQQELSKLGVKSDIGADFITIFPAAAKAAKIATYDDHRMAMSFAILGSRIDGLEIEDPQVVNKSFPAFWQHLGRLGILVKSQ